MANKQVALFPDWSTAVYVITWVPWLNLWGGLWFDDIEGAAPELSVALGSFQITTAENLLRSAYTSNGLVGHVIPNVGGRTSTIRTSVILDQLFQKTEEEINWWSIDMRRFR